MTTRSQQKFCLLFVALARVPSPCPSLSWSFLCHGLVCRTQDQIGGFTPSQVAPSPLSDPIEDSPAACPGAQASDTLPGPSAPSLAPTASAADGPLQSGSASVASVADADPGWGAGAPSDPQVTAWPSITRPLMPPAIPTIRTIHLVLGQHLGF